MALSISACMLETSASACIREGEYETSIVIFIEWAVGVICFIFGS